MKKERESYRQLGGDEKTGSVKTSQEERWNDYNAYHRRAIIVIEWSRFRNQVNKKYDADSDKRNDGKKKDEWKFHGHFVDDIRENDINGVPEIDFHNTGGKFWGCEMYQR